MTPNTSFPQEPDNFDKTMVEGSAASIPINQVPAGTKINVGQTRGAPKTYVPSGGNGPGDGILPTGDDPVPLGSGTIAGRLGTGGMATVYKIWNERLEVFRAIKILLPTHQADLKSRFETEGKITAKLRHPNVVEIFAVGEWNGLPFLEMELIEGQSLEAFITRADRLPITMCTAVGIAVARALVYAHSQEVLIYGKTYQGVIHRDLKPANIMIDKNGRVKLMDFGIARPTETSLHTVEGNIVGTLPYLSPEQIDGVDIDARVDIYALGTILYEMVTGTKTFPQKSVTNLMKNKITNQYRTFEDFDFKVPPVLAKIVQKCLQVERDDRYKNAKALLDALEAAHATLVNQTPEETVAAYCHNPFSKTESLPSRGGKRFSPLALIRKPAVWGSLAGAAVLGCVAIILVVTGPTGENSPAKEPPVSAAAQTPVATEAPVAPAQESQEGLRPLGASSSSTQAEAPLPSPKPEPVQPVRKTATPEPVAKAARTVPAPGASGKKEGSLAELIKKYNGSDALASGESALRSGSSQDAVLLLESVSTPSDRRTVLLLEAYTQSGRMSDARSIVTGSAVNDAQYVFLCGLYNYKSGNRDKALDFLQSAFTKPSTVRPRGDVLNDALYYTALIRVDNYRDEPTVDNKGIAMQALRVVKNAYQSNDSHPRYTRVVNELSTLK